MVKAEEIEGLCEASRSKLAALRERVVDAGSALVAFSAGVDSTFMLKIALDCLGERAVALTALSASLAEEEQREAVALAGWLGVRHLEVRSEEIANPGYAANPQNRCYFCKTELYELAERKRAELGLSVVMDGFNADDTRDYRPGHQAAREHQVRSPLAEVGLTKREIRAWSKALGLPTWDKPQMACLASRIPYGTRVTVERLGRIGAAESALRRLGLRSFRVRYHGEIARLEIAAAEYERFHSSELRASVNAALRAEGFEFVVLDLEPFRSGRLNEAAGISPAASPLPSQG